MRRSMLPLLASVFLLTAAPAAYAGLCYVTTAGSSANDGSSWSKSMDLQTALATSTCSPIWVKAGVYKPSTNDNTVSFVIPPGVQVYGGFAGTEDPSSYDPTEDADRAANVVANLTVLSGDLNGDDSDVDSGNGVDTAVSAHNSDNSVHVVSIDGTTTAVTSDTVLDGFTITAGNADGDNLVNDLGGGLYCNGAGGECSPTLSHLDFSGNFASLGGGGLGNRADYGTSSPALINVAFSGNAAFAYGGGLENFGENGTSSPTLTNVTFNDNSTTETGGAMLNDAYDGASNPTLTNVTFSGNSSFQGGALGNNYGNSTLTNVTFDGNSATGGGGGAIFNAYGTLTLSNVILWGDTAASSGGDELDNYGGTATTTSHSIVQGSGGSGLGWDTTLGTDGGGNLDADPKLGALANNGGATQTLLPGSGSAAIDGGTCVTSADQRGIARPQGLGCDIGAVEVVQTGSIGVCYVWASATGANNGTSWTNAYVDLQSALNNQSCTEIWVAKGVYIPIVPADPSNITEDEVDISFNVRPGLAVYGGFVGTETSRGQRNPDPLSNGTVLSGDLGHDDCDGSGCPGGVDTDHTQIHGSNTYNIVWMDGTTSAGRITASTVLDGFTITGAGTNGHAGGLGCVGEGSGHECSPTLSNLVFSGNDADNGGSAIYDDGENGGVSSPTLTNIVITGGFGTAMVNDGSDYGTSNPLLTDVTFSNNEGGDYGGAIYDWAANYGVSSPTLTNVTISGNRANEGGAIYNDGSSGGDSNPSLTNVTISGNNASYGGAIYNYGDSGNTSPTLSNVILWGDTAGSDGNEIFNDTATPTIDHSIVQGSGGSASWDTALGTDGGGNLDADPELGPLANNGGVTQTMLPGAGSAAIDAGDDTECPTTDQRGVTRPQGPHCDIGAVEVATAGYIIGGVASGQTGAVVLQLDGTSPTSTQQLTLATGDTSFTFAMPLVAGSNWSVSVFSAPSGQSCSLANASGSAIAASVTNVALTCANVAVAIAPLMLTDAVYGVAYSQTLTASSSSGAAAPYTFSLASGSLPPGTTLTAGGALIGTPSAVGSYAFTVQATSANSYSGTQGYTLTVDKKSATVTLNATPMPAVVGHAVTLTATVVGDPPTGTVAFTDGGTPLPCSPATLSPGATSSIAICTATFTTTGTHQLDASYGGDENYAAMTASPVTLVVNAATTTTTPVPAPMLDRLGLLALLAALCGSALLRQRMRRR
jgi:predicted outer membrane repeat protein